MPQILRADLRQLLDLIHEHYTQASEPLIEGIEGKESGHLTEHSVECAAIVKRIEERLTYLLETTDDASIADTIIDQATDAPISDIGS